MLVSDLFKKIIRPRLVLSNVLLLGACLFVIAGIVCVIIGFPPIIGGVKIKIKNLNNIFEVVFILSLLSLLFHPQRILKSVSVTNALSGRNAFLFLTAIYGVLFVWQQVNEYLALDINFIPFSFYNYMLYYFQHGQWNYTNLLHQYYHANLIMVLFEPIWSFFKSPLILVLSHGLVPILAAFPLWGIVRHVIPDRPIAANLVIFLFFSSKLLQSVLKMNFGVEIFYSFFLFALIYFALKKQWAFYYLALFLLLTVKEDAFIYAAGIGAMVFFVVSKRAGLATVFVALGYFCILSSWILPYLDNDILSRSIRNYSGHGSTEIEIIKQFIAQPWKLGAIFFDSRDKLSTWGDINSRLFFIPLFSPVGLLLFVPLFPLFLHSHGRSTDFSSLHFHYAAAVLPFLFLAFIYGLKSYSTWIRKAASRFQPWLWWAPICLIVWVNGGAYATRAWGKESLTSIAWAKSIPSHDDVLTHGHLMPYIGYRVNNFYMASVWENTHHYAHEAYTNARYVLYDLSVNPYPLNSDGVKERLQSMKSNRSYRLTKTDGVRFLFEKNTQS